MTGKTRTLSRGTVWMLLPCLFALLALPAQADLEVTDLWSRATAPGASTGAVYGHLRNSGTEPLLIVGVTSTVAEKVQLHRSTSRNGMMGMEHVPHVRLEAGQELHLAPGGMHIMLMGLEKRLEQGQIFNVEIVSEDQVVSGKVTVGTVGQMEPP